MITAALAILIAAVAQPPAAPVGVGAGGVGGGSAAGSVGSVQLRGQVAPLSGEIAGVTYAGVLLKVTPEDPGRLIAWDKVRAVEGGAVAASAFLPYADALMRARARLERGDMWLADQAIEPLYQHAVTALGEGGGSGGDRFVGPSGLLLAECALRSSLERNASASATLAWLQWTAVDRQHQKPSVRGGATPESKAPQWIGGTANLPTVIDTATGLCPRLPPIFPHQGPSSAGTLRVLTQSAHLKLLCAEGSLARGLAVPYALAARIAAGEVRPGDSIALPAPTNDAELLVSDIVTAQTALSEPMRAARARLLKRLEALQRDADTKETSDDAEAPVDRSWQRAWLHAAVGRSLLAEDQPPLRRQGLVELLHVPALDGATQPALASIALLDVIEQLRLDGEGAGTEGAIAALIAELRLRFGVEPALRPVDPVAPVPEPSAPSSAPAKPGAPSTPTPRTTTPPPPKEAP